MALTTNQGQGNNIVNEFPPDALVARYGKDGMTFWNGEFNERGEGIFVAFPKKDKSHPQSAEDHKHTHSVS